MTINPFGDFGTGYDHNVNTGSRLTRPKDKDSPTRGGGGGGGGGDPLPLPLPPDEPRDSKNPAAIPSFSFILKAGRRVDFINKSLNAVRYSWSFGKDTVGQIVGRSEQESPIFFYPNTGGSRTYTVSLRAYNIDGDFEETTQQVFVEHLEPDCDFSFIVSGTLVRFTNLSTDITAGSLWTFGDGETSTEGNPHHIYSGNGIYTVKLTKGSFSKTYIVTIDTELTLDCDDMLGATGYKWEHSIDGVIWEEFADTSVSEVGVTEAVYGIDSTTLNYFRVRAYNVVGDSDYSDIANVRCD